MCCVNNRLQQAQIFAQNLWAAKPRQSAGAPPFRHY
jgi:hypothetical protein